MCGPWNPTAPGDGRAIRRDLLGRPRPNWWGPDNSKLVFRAGQVTGRIWTAKLDGTGTTGSRLRRGRSRLVAGREEGRARRLLRRGHTDRECCSIYGLGHHPELHRTDWQPILRRYARPKAATPLYTSLVPAYEECTAPNRAHKAPLSFNSCNPPTQPHTPPPWRTPTPTPSPPYR